MTIEKITLNILPEVFADDADNVSARSDIWLKNCTLHRGKRYIVDAASGTGKSSLCAYLYGLRTDYRGTIDFDGTDVRTFGMTQWCNLRRDSLALMPQEPGLFPQLGALDNVRVKNNLTRCYTDNQIRDMLHRVGLDSRLDVPVCRLSVGQQQRVSLVRTLCQPFTFLFLDEPVSHLDAKNNAAATELVCDIAARNNAAIVCTSVGNPLLLADARVLNL